MSRLDYTIVDAILEDLDGIVAIYNSTITTQNGDDRYGACYSGAGFNDHG